MALGVVGGCVYFEHGKMVQIKVWDKIQAARFM